MSIGKNGVVSGGMVEGYDKVSAYKDGIIVNPNLLINSSYIKYSGAASGLTATNMDSDNMFKVVASSGNGNWCSLVSQGSSNSIKNSLSAGDKFVISFDMKTESGSGIPTIFLNAGNGYFKVLGNENLIGQWQRVYTIQTYSTPTSEQYTYCGLHLGFSSISGTFYFKNFKIEEGSKATPWCPNSADGYGTIEQTTINSPISMNRIIEY